MRYDDTLVLYLDSETVPEGMVVLLHPGVFEYIFIVDPDVWKMDQTMERFYEFLVHAGNPNCRIDILPGIGPP